MARTKKETVEEKSNEKDIKQVKEDLLEYINTDVKEDLNKYIEGQVKKEFLDILEKKHRREIKEKNRKLLVKNIIILLLLASTLVLIYILFDEVYYDRFFSDRNNNKEVVENRIIEEEGEEAPSLDELKAEYAYLLDKYEISINSNYLSDLYDKNLSNYLQLNYSLNNLDFSLFEQEEDYYVIDEELIKDKYEELFTDEYASSNFEYNGNRIRYFNKLKSYISNSFFEKDNSLIQREIINIEVDNDVVSITTVEAIISDNLVVNPKSKEIINEEYDGNLLDYQDLLEQVTYEFENNKLNSLK